MCLRSRRGQAGDDPGTQKSSSGDFAFGEWVRRQDHRHAGAAFLQNSAASGTLHCAQQIQESTASRQEILRRIANFSSVSALVKATFHRRLSNVHQRAAQIGPQLYCTVVALLQDRTGESLRFSCQSTHWASAHWVVVCQNSRCRWPASSRHRSSAR